MSSLDDLIDWSSSETGLGFPGPINFMPEPWLDALTSVNSSGSLAGNVTVRAGTVKEWLPSMENSASQDPATEKWDINGDGAHQRNELELPRKRGRPKTNRTDSVGVQVPHDLLLQM